VIFSNLWKSFTVPETRVFRATDGENGQTELRWLRRATAVGVGARKNELIFFNRIEIRISEIKIKHKKY